MRLLLSHRFFIPWVLFATVLCVGMVLISRIGPAWDEPDNIFAGGQYAYFFQHNLNPSFLTTRSFTTSIFAPTIFTQEPSISRYPPIPNYLGTALAILLKATTGQEVIYAFHLATVVFLAILVVTVYAFGNLLGLSLPWSIAAACMTFLHPTVFGHGLSNLKDTAQVALFTASLYFLVRFFMHQKLSDVIMGSFVWGLSLATKFNAVYVPIILFAWIALTSPKKRQDILFLPLILSIGAISAIAVWPYLWTNTATHIQQVIGYFTSVGQGYKFFWDGTLYQVGVGRSFWWYPWMNLLFTTPIPLLLLWGASVVSFFQPSHRAVQRTTLTLLFIWLFLPLLRAILPSAAFYDGMRHFMEVFPAGILLTTWGARFICQHFRISPFLTRLGLIGLFFFLILINVQHFPYSTGYFNLFARNTNTHFDRDIEALSVKEGVEYLQKHYDTMTLWSPIGGHLSWYYLRPSDRYVYSSQEADSIILVNKSSHIRQKEFEALIANDFSLQHTISRGDDVFAWIYKRK